MFGVIDKERYAGSILMGVGFECVTPGSNKEHTRRSLSGHSLERAKSSRRVSKPAQATAITQVVLQTCGTSCCSEQPEDLEPEQEDAESESEPEPEREDSETTKKKLEQTIKSHRERIQAIQDAEPPGRSLQAAISMTDFIGREMSNMAGQSSAILFKQDDIQDPFVNVRLLTLTGNKRRTVPSTSPARATGPVSRDTSAQRSERQNPDELMLMTDYIHNGGTDCEWDDELQFSGLKLGGGIQGSFCAMVIDVWDFDESAFGSDPVLIGEVMLEGDDFQQMYERASQPGGYTKKEHPMTRDGEPAGTLVFSCTVTPPDPGLLHELKVLYNELQDLECQLTRRIEMKHTWKYPTDPSYEPFQHLELPGTAVQATYLKEPPQHLYELRVYVYQARGLKIADPDGQADPFVKACISGATGELVTDFDDSITEDGGQKQLHTSVKSNTTNPVWNEILRFETIKLPDEGHAHLAPELVLELFDEDSVFFGHFKNAECLVSNFRPFQKCGVPCLLPVHNNRAGQWCSWIRCLRTSRRTQTIPLNGPEPLASYACARPSLAMLLMAAAPLCI
eukprot:SAG31_NODE_94_length_26208_cov_6.281091_7_plen_565_part_00